MAMTPKPIKITGTASGSKKAVNYTGVKKINKNASKIVTGPAKPIKKTTPPTAAKSNAMLKGGMMMNKRAGNK